MILIFFFFIYLAFLGFPELSIILMENSSSLLSLIIQWVWLGLSKWWHNYTKLTGDTLNFGSTWSIMNGLGGPSPPPPPIWAMTETLLKPGLLVPAPAEQTPFPTWLPPAPQSRRYTNSVMTGELSQLEGKWALWQDPKHPSGLVWLAEAATTWETPSESGSEVNSFSEPRNGKLTGSSKVKCSEQETL